MNSRNEIYDLKYSPYGNDMFYKTALRLLKNFFHTKKVLLQCQFMNSLKSMENDSMHMVLNELNKQISFNKKPLNISQASKCKIIGKK
jgi:hypothetical protein